MKAPHFRFRLERVRALREREEDLAREQLAASLSHHLAGEAMLARAREELAGARAAGCPDSAACGTDFLARQMYMERRERDEREAILESERREVEVDRRRDELRLRATDRQALERLKERRAAEHAREWARRESAELDEVGLAVHRRKEAA